MALETELKLRIAPEHLNRLKRHPLLKTLATARATTRKLYNIYYDTPDLDLHQGAMALRLRRIGRKWLQTLKGGGRVQAGLHSRNEWETPVHDAALDFEALEASGARHLPKALRKKLQAIFATDFSRTSRMVVFEGAEIEFSLDSGEIRAGGATHPVSELELELKSGEPLQLFRLALVLLDIVPLEVESTSKAEYGYRLFAKFKPAVTQAHMPDLTQAMDISTVLQQMLWSCLFHLQANVPGAIQMLDDEYLHQVRVALRRLRVVLGMVKTFCADDELIALSSEVAALSVELGRAREWDVFVTQTLALVRARLPDHAGLRNVLAVSVKLREQHHIKVRDALQAHSFQRLLLRFGAWMNDSYWCKAQADKAFTLPAFAAQILQQRSKQVKKYGARLGKQTAGNNVNELHALRISCKKLRYGAELFAALYAPEKVKHYLAALTRLQDTLGALNDIAVARRLLDELDAEVQHETVELIRGWIEHDYTKRIVEFNKGWQKFFRQKPFWG